MNLPRDDFVEMMELAEEEANDIFNIEVPAKKPINIELEERGGILGIKLPHKKPVAIVPPPSMSNVVPYRKRARKTPLSQQPVKHFNRPTLYVHSSTPRDLQEEELERLRVLERELDGRIVDQAIDTIDNLILTLTNLPANDRIGRKGDCVLEQIHFHVLQIERLFDFSITRDMLRTSCHVLFSSDLTELFSGKPRFDISEKITQHALFEGEHTNGKHSDTA